MYRLVMAAQLDKLHTVASKDLINHSPNGEKWIGRHDRIHEDGAGEWIARDH